MDSGQAKSERLVERLRERWGDPTVELHQAYDSWLADMASRKDTLLEPFDLNESNNPEQNIYVPKVEYEPQHPHLPDSLFYLGFRFKMGRSIGHTALWGLVDQFNSQLASTDDNITTLPQRLNKNQQEGKNTLVVTSHIKFEEMGYAKTIRILGKKDRANFNLNGVLFNKLMTRQEYRGVTLVKRFSEVGAVYFSSPDTPSADLHNVPRNAAMLTNALFKNVLETDLEAGGLELDAALSGSEVKPVLDDNGKFSHYSIPEIRPSSAKLIKDFDEAVGMTLVGPPMSHRWQMHVSEVLDVQELLKTNEPEAVTDMVYTDIVGALERFTKREVEYKKVAGRIGRTAVVNP